ncbi:Protein of unknown function [Bacillus toyonensis]|nr:Protein of unknown function [Bacillus mycoides]SCN19999.1 Protein of unknown function [Bacillus toyonensis]
MHNKEKLSVLFL